MIPWAVIDTNLYIDHWEHGLHDEALDRVRRAFIVRHSAVVLSELRRGARTRKAERAVARLRALARDLWAPTDTDWWEAGRLIRTIGDAQDWDRTKSRDVGYWSSPGPRWPRVRSVLEQELHDLGVARLGGAQQRGRAGAQDAVRAAIDLRAVGPTGTAVRTLGKGDTPKTVDPSVRVRGRADRRLALQGPRRVAPAERQ